MRPPSSGKAGTRLNASTSTLIVASQLSHTSAGVAWSTSSPRASFEKVVPLVSSRPATTHATITTSVTSGPAAATRNSVLGSRDSLGARDPAEHPQIDAGYLQAAAPGD